MQNAIKEGEMQVQYRTRCSMPGRGAFARRRTGLLRVMIVSLVCLVPALGNAQGNAQDNSAQILERLSNFTDTLTSFSAGFTQTVYDADSNPLQSSAGQVLLKRPGRFVWNYKSPSPQKIIADGKSVWLYDMELEQVTVSSLADQSSGTPLALLMGDKPLEQEFSLRVLGTSEGIDWVELTPHSGHSDFEQVFLGLNEQGLAAMELRDSFGQATQIRFSDFKSGVSIDDGKFRFVPPAGVDVIGEG